MAGDSDLVANRAIDEFCQRHNLASASPLQPDLQVIALMAQGMESFSDALGSATSGNLIPVEEPAWALVRAMILRGFAHADAGFVCLATGSVATAEVVSRAVLECALNVLFILQEDRAGRLCDYLAAYVKQERAELERWEEMLCRMPLAEASVHQKEIERKREAVDQQELIAKEFASGAGITRPAQPWPKIGERFRAVGSQLDYRVLYAAMCSQAHNDAEDLFNTFVLGAMSHLNPGQVAREFELRQKAEMPSSPACSCTGRSNTFSGALNATVNRMRWQRLQRMVLDATAGCATWPPASARKSKANGNDFERRWGRHRSASNLSRPASSRSNPSPGPAKLPDTAGLAKRDRREAAGSPVRHKVDMQSISLPGWYARLNTVHVARRA